MMKIGPNLFSSICCGNRIRFLAAALVLLLGVLLFFSVRNGDLLAEKAPIGSPPEQAQSKSRIRTFSDESAQRKVAELTHADDVTITAIVEQLKEMESKRAAFCRKLEDDSRTLYEYLIKCPGPDEILKLKQIASEARGLTEDLNGERISWELQILNEFIPSPKYEYLILTVKYNKSTGRGRYDVTGVPYGNLDMRDGISPISRDGRLYPVSSNVPIGFNSRWRFDKIFNGETESREEK